MEKYGSGPVEDMVDAFQEGAIEFLVLISRSLFITLGGVVAFILVWCYTEQVLAAVKIVGYWLMRLAEGCHGVKG